MHQKRLGLHLPLPNFVKKRNTILGILCFVSVASWNSGCAVLSHAFLTDFESSRLAYYWRHTNPYRVLYDYFTTRTSHVLFLNINQQKKLVDIIERSQTSYSSSAWLKSTIACVSWIKSHSQVNRCQDFELNLRVLISLSSCLRAFTTKRTEECSTIRKKECSVHEEESTTSNMNSQVST